MPSLRPATPLPPPEVAAPDAAAPQVPAPKGQPANPQKFAVTVGPSAIDGQGAFAAEPIPARRKIGEVRGEFVSLTEARRRAREAERTTGRIFMVAISDQRAVDASASTDPLRFANHACEPNAQLKVQQGRVALYALHDIAPGEEITVRYGPTHHGGRLRCQCGSVRCIGSL